MADTSKSQGARRPRVRRLSLRIAECAESLGISKRHVFTLIRERGLPHVRLGSAIVIPVLELQRWLSNEAAKQAGKGVAP